MDNYQELQKIIKKGKKISKPSTIVESLVKQISDNYSEKKARELNFLSMYYGLQGDATTLEAIGETQEHKLTRERVRQIIDGILKTLTQERLDYDNPYEKAKSAFKDILNARHFVRIEELLKSEIFSEFKKNVRGLISFLNDCGIRQVAYRKNYYFYPDSISRMHVVDAIQKENKVRRRERTLEKMAAKAKTVTYVPEHVRTHLTNHAKKAKINLNSLYENILSEFISVAPFSDVEYIFVKTKSWKARKGKAQWEQIGIFIDRAVFDNIRDNIAKIKDSQDRTVSTMSFICQAFTWHYTKHA